jgi:hypothetical protein
VTDVHEPTAPASPAAPTQTISAARAASDKGDFAAFEEATLAERRGTPLARVAATPATPTAPPTSEPPAAPAPPAQEPAQPPAADRAVSKRQQQINNYERKIAEQDQRIRALEASLTRPAPPERQPPAPAQPSQAQPTQTWQDSVRRPDLSQPMLGEEQFFQRFPDAPYSAYARYAVRYEDHAERAQAQQSSEQEQLTTAQHARVEKFVGQLDQARASDPEFVNKLTPEVRNLKPFAALAPGEASGPLNVVAEQVFDSPIAPQVLLHFSQHSDALQRLATMPPEIAAMPPAQRARAHIQWIVKEFGKIEAALEQPAVAAEPAAAAPSPISAAPPPAPILSRVGTSTDPQAAAFARGDFATWDRIEMEKEQRRRGRA